MKARNPTMRDIAWTINKPVATVQRWKKDNKALFKAVMEYTERQNLKREQSYESDETMDERRGNRPCHNVE